MFTRSELEIKTLLQLRNLCFRYGIKPIGQGRTKADYINALLLLPTVAIRQMHKGEGLKKPHWEAIKAINEAIYREHLHQNNQHC